MTVKVRKDNVDRFRKSLELLTTKEVLIGIPGDSTARTDEFGKSLPVTNASLGYIHEFGSPARNIPARPFLLPGVANALPRVTEIFRRAAEQTNLVAAEQAMHAAGMLAVSAVRAKITDGPFAPLAPATIAARKAKGRTGEMRPLIDTGQMRLAITYVIRDKSR